MPNSSHHQSTGILGFNDRWIDRLFGYDFFISYAHADGQGYPKSLLDQLSAKGFKAFLDHEEFAVGDELDRETRRRVTMSSYLLVVLGPEALRSQWVRREVELFVEAGRTPIIIQQPSLAPELIEHFDFIDSNWLRHLETDPSEPSPETMSVIESSFKRRRRETVRKRILSSAAIILISAVGVGGFFSVSAKQERIRQEEATAERLAAQARTHLDQYRFEEAALLSLASTSISGDGKISDSQIRMLTEASAVYFGSTIVVGEPNSGRPRAVAFSKDESYLSIANNEGSLLFATRLGDEMLEVELWEPDQAGYNSPEYFTAIEATPDGKYFIAGDDVGQLHWVSTETLAVEIVGKEHAGPIWDIAMSNDGSTIATGGGDNTVQIWDATTRKHLHGVAGFAPDQINGRSNQVQSVSFSPIDNLVAVATEDNTFQIFEPNEQELLRSFADFPNEPPLGSNWTHFVGAVEWHPSGKLVSTGSVDGHLRHWPFADNAPELQPSNLQQASVNMQRLLHFKYLRNERYIAAAYDSGDLVLFDTNSGKVILELFGTQHWTEDLKLSPSGRYLANAAGDGRVWIWDLQAVFMPDLIDRLCQRLDAPDGSLSAKWSSLQNELQMEEIVIDLCSVQHRELLIEPVINYVND